ncbi:MAG: hypothetical protein PUD25_00160 [Bacilli bacterium]|nr:hypothetical protein [Bacilli bacterium]
MNKFDYDDIVTKIKILELKLKRNSLEKERYTTLKNYSFSLKERREWDEKYNLLVEEEEAIFAHLYTVYEEFAQMIALKKKQ